MRDRILCAKQLVSNSVEWSARAGLQVPFYINFMFTLDITLKAPGNTRNRQRFLDDKVHSLKPLFLACESRLAQ